MDTVSLTDTAYTLPIALSLVREGNVDLNEYPYAEGMEIKGRLLSFFPLGTPILAAPLVFLIDLALRLGMSFDLYDHLMRAADWVLVARIHTLIASFLTAITALIVYASGRLFLDVRRALLLGLIFAFCTSAWSTASRDLWSHTSSILFLSLTLYLCLRAEAQPQLIQYASIPLALAYVMRPTNSISVLLLTVYVGIEYREYLIRYLFWSLLIAAPFILLNLSLFGSLLPPYYAAARLANNPDFIEALAANLVSPSRGLLVYSPVFLFAIAGAAIKIKRSNFRRLDGFIVGILLLHWLMISSFKHWHAGAAFGPRFFVDMLPYLMLFLIPVLDELRAPAAAGRWAMALTLVVLAAISLFINYRGGTQRATWDWSMTFLNVVESIDDARDRVWDWSDPQFWRGLRPPHLVVAPPSLCITERQQASAPAAGQLMLSNHGDKPLVWQVSTPRRLFDQPAVQEIPSLGYGELAVIADSGGLEAGLHSLGALEIIARSTAEDKPVRGSPAIVPVTLRLLSARDAPHAGDDQGCYALSPDILVNEEQQVAGADRLQAIYGAGWYDMETAGDIAYRWAFSPARLYIQSPVEQEMELAASAIALHDASSLNGLGAQGKLAVRANGQALASLDLQAGQPFSLKLKLQRGWNTIDFDLAAGNFQPVEIDPTTGDSRLLSFALSRIALTY